MAQRQQQPQLEPLEQAQLEPQEQLSEATALRLLSSVVAGTATQPTQSVSQTQMATPALAESDTVGQEGSSGCGVGAPQMGRVLSPDAACQESVHSCRICHWHRSNMEIIICPCNCMGSVGYIHLQCLKCWIMHKRNNRCEVCNAPFNITEERASLRQMVRAFCCGRCCGMIVKHLLFSASLMPLAHVILQQVLHCMDNLNQGSTEQLTVQEVFVASWALLTSSALFFHFFEFMTTRVLLIRNILGHWWMFGSMNDFAIMDDDAFDLF